MTKVQAKKVSKLYREHLERVRLIDEQSYVSLSDKLREEDYNAYYLNNLKRA